MVFDSSDSVYRRRFAKGITLMRCVYVVFGETGEFADRQEWIVAIFTDAHDAIRHAQKAQARADEIKVCNVCNKDWVVCYCDEKPANEYDRRCVVDYTGTDYDFYPTALFDDGQEYSKQATAPEWKLWLDDQSFDLEVPERKPPKDFFPAESTKRALHMVDEYGLPSFIDFDHDLGGDDKATNFLRELIYKYPDGPVPEYRIHSANPVGAANIQSLMESWKKTCA